MKLAASMYACFVDAGYGSNQIVASEETFGNSVQKLHQPSLPLGLLKSLAVLLLGLEKLRNGWQINAHSKIVAFDSSGLRFASLLSRSAQIQLQGDESMSSDKVRKAFERYEKRTREMEFDVGPPRPLQINVRLLNYRANRLLTNETLDKKKALSRLKRGQIPDEVVDKVLETLDRCNSLDPTYGKAWLTRSRIMEELGDDEEAELLLKQGLQANTKSFSLVLALSQLYDRTSRLEQAIVFCEKALSINPIKEAAWVHLGLMFEQQRRYKAAATCFLTAGKVAPSEGHVWQVLGEFHKRRGENDAAREAYARAMDLIGEDPCVLHPWGMLEFNLGNYDAAGKLFRRAIKVDPTHEDSWQSLAWMIANTESYDAAELAFSNASAIYNGYANPAIWQARASFYCKRADRFEKMGDMANVLLFEEKARRCFRRGMTVDPHWSPLYLAWGLFEASRVNGFDRIEIARSIFLYGIQQSGRGITRLIRNPAPLFLELASMECAAANVFEEDEKRIEYVAAARKYFEKAIEADPYSADARIRWAYHEAEEGNIEVAMQLYEDAIQLDRRNKDLWLQYEDLTFTFGSPADAMQVWQRTRDVFSKPLSNPTSDSGNLPPGTLRKAARFADRWSRLLPDKQKKIADKFETANIFSPDY